MCKLLKITNGILKAKSKNKEKGELRNGRNLTNDAKLFRKEKRISR